MPSWALCPLFLQSSFTLWFSFDFVLALVSSPVGISDTFCESLSVGINSSPGFPNVYVSPVIDYVARCHCFVKKSLKYYCVVTSAA